MSIAPLTHARSIAPSLTALLALAMPKCPLCAMALLSAFGIELRAIAPVTIALIGVSVLLIAIRRSSLVPVLIAAAGGICAIAGRFSLDAPLLFHAGVLAIAGAAVFNAIALRRLSCACVARREKIAPG